MAELFLLFNHTITPVQEQQARLELGVERITEPPEDIRRTWAAIPPQEENIAPILAPVIAWLDDHAAPGDYVLIQGDFGACFLLAIHAMNRGYIPVYSTTERHAVEKKLDDGGVRLTHTFRHVRFRKYGQ
jgi:hypothetical protein